MAPPVCKFWQQGNCRNGDRCKFLHPTQYDSRSNSRDRSYTSSSRSNNTTQNRAPATLPYQLDKAAISTDLKEERPQWILSAYGPGRNAPGQLFGGPLREQSFEEMRILHYMGLASGNVQQAINEAGSLWTAAEQQIQAALNDLDGAINFIISAEKDHPNRIDIIRESQARSAGSSQPNPFNNPAPPQPFSASNPFGDSSNQPTAPAFGAPPTQTGAFGQPSNHGLTAFAAPGGAFGQPSASNQGSAPFGAASFGRPSQPAAFGQPSISGQRSNPFGAASTNNGGFTVTPNPNSNPFGKPSQPGQVNPFEAPNPQASAPAFGQPSVAPSQPFGAQPAPQNPFGAKLNSIGATTSSTPFSQTQPSPSVAASPFGQPSAPGNTNSFGKQPFNVESVTSPTLFGTTSQPQTSTSNGTFVFPPHPPLSSYSTKDASGRLATFKGKRVIYKGDEAGFTNNEGKWQKIWFPDGPPTSFEDVQVPSEFEYDEQTIAAYAYAMKTGNFEGGKIPLLPPKPEWIRYDF